MNLNQIQILAIIVMAFSTSGISQPSIGVELRTSRNITYNSSKIEGGGYGFGGYKVLKEGNPTTSSYSIGIIFSPNNSNIFKLHIGRHQNGRIIDLTLYSDTGTYDNFENVDFPYNYIQFVPSYAYNILKGKFNVPIELGFAINKRIKEGDIFFVGINEYNYDIRLSSGIQYKLNHFNIGSNIVYSQSIDNYGSEDIAGEFKPYQIGIELGIGYTFKLKKKNTMTNK